MLAFVLTEEELRLTAERLLDNRANDAVIWIAYPKKSSGKYKSSINRDCGWEPLAVLEVEPVRQVAVNDDWSALRFRQVKYIKKLNRKGWVLGKEGKKRIKEWFFSFFGRQTFIFLEELF